MMLGVMIFSVGALLALGNVLFLGGLLLIIGPQKTFYFFAWKNKLRWIACFLGGIVLVFLKWPTIGVLVEMFGFLNLFGDFFPIILTFLRQLSFMGSFLNLPYILPVPYDPSLLPFVISRSPISSPRASVHGLLSRFTHLCSIVDTASTPRCSALPDHIPAVVGF